MKHERFVLLADDDENDVLFIQRSFSKAEIGDRLRTVSDGVAVMEYLQGAGPYGDRTAYPLPSLLVMDLKMPRRTGLEVLEWMRGTAEFRCLPVMIFSSSVYAPDIHSAYAAGANAFVTKPSGLAERAELVQLIKGFWLRFNVLAR
ncbi:two-component system response regulator [Verrucomicrobia bacterium LW23]|nr:two-component system response regulator [Verrucomicrobia bacterium LW23]